MQGCIVTSPNTLSNCQAFRDNTGVVNVKNNRVRHKEKNHLPDNDQTRQRGVSRVD